MLGVNFFHHTVTNGNERITLDCNILNHIKKENIFQLRKYAYNERVVCYLTFIDIAPIHKNGRVKHYSNFHTLIKIKAVIKVLVLMNVTFQNSMPTT